MRISIPEVDTQFETIEDALDDVLQRCQAIVEAAKPETEATSAHGIAAYELAFSQKVLVQASSFVKVARERNDYNSVCALVRILADNISILNLIYGNASEEERALRHYLYVIDGVSTRLSLARRHSMRYDGKMSRSVYDALKQQAEKAKANAENCLRSSVEAIQRLALYQAHSAEIDQLIGSRNWKYKRFDLPQKEDGYSWQEMYGMLDIKMGEEALAYFSQYVHGNISLCDADDYDPPLSFALCLLEWMLGFLKRGC